MIGLALLGAGIFAHEQHLPAIEGCSDFALKAIYSRSQKSADALSAKAKASVDVYSDDAQSQGKSLDDLLAREDISAVVVCLPILTQPAVIKKALNAGKHVLSEKPIAGTAASANELINYHASLSRAPIWAVAENFRFVKSLGLATEKIKEVGGNLVSFSLHMANMITTDNRYWKVDWRKVPEYQGGFLLDGGVHHLAGLRLLLKAAGHQVQQVACFSSLLQERLLPVDTLRATLLTNDGAAGVLSMSFGTEFGSGFEIEVVTTQGRVTWTPSGIKSVTKSSNSEKTENSEDIKMDNGVPAEFKAFAQSISSGSVDPRQTPEEGLGDIRLLEALLRSGEAGGEVKSVA